MSVPYQLPNGKTVMLTIDQILNLDDIGIQDLMAKNAGWEIEDPFSDLDYKDFQQIKYEIPKVDDIEPLDETFIEEIKKEIDGEELG